ncbi:hypothetical protein ABZ516_22505 [Streptomyces sp. NPDC019826]|uniref:WXG100 family type VII secretion target n=1 Tax=unclassified Streptomyces TaxID=2593676 RepID=UPI00099894F8|nr:MULTISPECIES: hypothetical protein [Streptomyces]MCY1653995.1 hypothetical protein [Streptomyces sp. SL203]MCY1678730.1 hypothetical protein [Streptomyces sp. SL294]WSZ50519.1 hypothetical protein OG337_25555 [[Kitasatospora] papulosa]
MSEPKKPSSSSEAEPELTPAEQREQDQGRVQGQLLVTDVTRQVQGVMESFGFGSGSSGRTSFEGHDLNAMIDLIENSKPEDLESAGEALLKARTALRRAADDLRGFIEGVDWEGESEVAFRNWGKGLVAHAQKLGDFAETAGTQITVAGTGLASVRNSLPPRDTRLNKKSPDEVEAPKRVEGNAEYAAAVKVEKDRQEAINQANRLASYYAVSEETLAAQEPPRFEKKLDVAVPRPSGQRGVDDQSDSSSSGSNSSGAVDTGRVPGPVAVGSQGSAAEHSGFEGPLAVSPVPDRSTSTEINSVATPPTPVTTPGVPSPQPTVSPASGGTTPPIAPGFVSPVSAGARGFQGAAGVPRSAGQTVSGGSRTSGPAGGGAAANGRAGSPVGRPSPMSGGSASGTAGRGGLGAQSPTAGRSGITGGRPMATGQPTSGSSGPRAGRASGIVGGTPQRASTPGGTRGVPRGTVIGSGSASRASGPTGAVGQRGVVGNATNATSRPSGRGTPSTKGVVGTPRGAGGAAGGKGFTSGGAGLVRGPAGRKDSKDEDQDEGTQRPDYLTEDRETWDAGRRGVSPPVIE